jgi:hypothetical protein
VAISVSGWEEANISPLTLEVPVQEANWSTIFLWFGGWTAGVLVLLGLGWFAVRMRKRFYPRLAQDRAPAKV